MTPKDVLDQAGSMVHEVYLEFVRFPWESREAYANWLYQTYCYVRYTTRCLALAAARCDPAETGLHVRLLHHAIEELGHEALCLNDLKALDRRPEEFNEHPASTAIYTQLLDSIETVDPTFIFGYALVLEGLAAGPVVTSLPKIEAIHGRRACSFIRVHCSVDPEHVKETQPVLEICSAKQLEAIVLGARGIATLYPKFLRAAAEVSSGSFA